MSFRAAWSNLLQTFIMFSILLDSIRQLSWMQYFKVTVSKCAFSLPVQSAEAAHQTALKGSVIISTERVWSGRGEGTLSLTLPFKVIEFVGWIHRIWLQQEHITAWEWRVFGNTATGFIIITLRFGSLWQCSSTAEHKEASMSRVVNTSSTTEKK